MLAIALKTHLQIIAILRVLLNMPVAAVPAMTAASHVAPLDCTCTQRTQGCHTSWTQIAEACAADSFLSASFPTFQASGLDHEERIRSRLGACHDGVGLATSVAAHADARPSLNVVRIMTHLKLQQ